MNSFKIRECQAAFGTLSFDRMEEAFIQPALETDCGGSKGTAGKCCGPTQAAVASPFGLSGVIL
ncbi:MAG: hypothetical protein HDR26_02380 [Lachnospiraceae bacterium]|nr:hypothetical protein [Lachnospiraceae bacterium]